MLSELTPPDHLSELKREIDELKKLVKENRPFHKTWMFNVLLIGVLCGVSLFYLSMYQKQKYERWKVLNSLFEHKFETYRTTVSTIHALKTADFMLSQNCAKDLETNKEFHANRIGSSFKLEQLALEGGKFGEAFTKEVNNLIEAERAIKDICAVDASALLKQIEDKIAVISQIAHASLEEDKLEIKKLGFST